MSSSRICVSHRHKRSAFGVADQPTCGTHSLNGYRNPSSAHRTDISCVGCRLCRVDEVFSRLHSATQEFAIVLPRDVDGHGLAGTTERTAHHSIDRKRESYRVAYPENRFVMHLDRLLLSRLHQAIHDARSVNSRREPAQSLRPDIELQQVALGREGPYRLAIRRSRPQYESLR